jgi:hypothetical protein
MLKYKEASQELFRNYFPISKSLEKSCGKGRVKVGLVKVVMD